MSRRDDVERLAREYLRAMADRAPDGRVRVLVALGRAPIAHPDAGSYAHTGALCSVERPFGADAPDRAVLDERALWLHRQLRGGGR